MAWGAPFTDSVFTSTSNKVVFRVGSPETAEQIARLIGTKTMQGKKINYSLADGSQTAKGLTETEGDEFLAHPNTLKNLGVGEALMIVQRKTGREPHHGSMIAAPKWLPLENGQLGQPTPPPPFTPLVLKATVAVQTAEEALASLRMAPNHLAKKRAP
jgi:hypothetical protein